MIKKKFTTSMLSGVVLSANLAPFSSLKNTAAASLSSMRAKCKPKQILVPAPNG